MVDPYASISAVSSQIRQGTLSPVSVVDACLARVEALNPRLNAFITVRADQARAAAQAAEAEIVAGRWRGALHGVPVAVKDFYDTAGVRTTAAFERFANRVPTKDAVLVASLKAAGAIILGKTNMDTLGMATTGLVSFYGPVRNPWNADYISGGSSSGSAVAVATGMCYATVDTDAVGSCRLPAACCGVVGFKGTYGLLSTEGILAGEPPPDETIVWLSHPVTTRRVSDIACVLDVLKARDIRPWLASYSAELIDPQPMRIGVVSNFRADKEVLAAFNRAVEAFAGFGHIMKKMKVAFIDPRVGIRHIERDRKTVSQQMFGEVDALLLPTTTKVTRRTSVASDPQALSPENTLFANYYGLPAISVPCGFDSNGLPIGLQIVAGPSADLNVLALGHQYERASGRVSKHAPVRTR